MLRRPAFPAIALCLFASAAAAQDFNSPAYCEAMREQADSKNEIMIPIKEDILLEIYKRGEAATNKPMFQVLLTGKGDLTPYNNWLSAECNGLTLKQ